MRFETIIASAILALVVVVSIPVRGQSDQPDLRIGHGVTPPRVVTSPDPEYSEEARQAGLQGKCVLSLVVNSEGKPENITVSRRLGMGLDEKAVEAVRNWTFLPALKDGKPVAMRVEIAVTFGLGKHALRKAMREVHKAKVELHRNALKRVYRVEGVAAPLPCHATRKEDTEPAPAAISALNIDVHQYRLTSITFTNNKAITNASLLRSAFPIQDGESFDWNRVATGLRSLKDIYGEVGYASFKSSVEPQVDDTQHSIALQIAFDEGRQFYVDHINIAGVGERDFQRLRRGLYVKPGDLYNETLATLFLKSDSRLIAPDESIRNRIKLEILDINESVGSLVITYDFTACAN